MDYSRLMMGVLPVDGESGGSSDNPSVEPTTQTISEYFAEPNLPQQYVETLGAPFGDRYVYTIFMQGINVLPDIPSSAEGSELTARVKEYEDGTFYIMERYYVKQEGEWVQSGDTKTISAWTEEEESSGGTESSGGIVLLHDYESVLKIPQSGKDATFNDICEYLDDGKVVVIKKHESLGSGYYNDTYSYVNTVYRANGECRVNNYRATSPTLPLIREEDEEQT